ncbi:DUF4250 domain-containing protein [Aeromonas schubertii]|uniref:DUF4250 domain-containing protein n=1 Tax=Aeromonas schubertii TaxID=652 RepID=A0A0S2SGB6_9GAMM|nr:DUF4250 domain-containing protein [Aeromonas schubertii]ALP40716.1 hypothetical protein WL1483_1297 [Aeromonas schubertii]KUE79012.1 hypothetical protein ATO46_06830 [Aeromonas schubertii]MBZ6065770.1 DUF4250 domain-containing protein [Aeromonas schubertii]MBZ6072065.1 DUF4250 domain-containing protein [Aeromonas schubertii]QCG48233.1 DUF4250 domain-containing protein [Aeromonas schubertii]
MGLERFATMDINMLLSLVNMQLRDNYDDLDDLVRAHDIDRTALEARLAEGGFAYQPAQRQFR